MNKMKRFALIAVCAALLVCVTIGATVAYLTSKTDEVVNTFTVGDVKITLDEAQVTTDGTPVEPEVRVKQNEYHLLPGSLYTKDPTVHVDDSSEDCIVFVTVDNGIAAIEAPASETYTPIDDQMTANGWQKLSGHSGVYYKAAATDKTLPARIEAGTDLKVFDNFMISYDADGTALKAKEDARITIKAFAIQYMNTTAADAWDLLSMVPEATPAPEP